MHRTSVSTTHTKRGVVLAIAAAVLFGTSTPAAKALLASVPAMLLAGLLYTPTTQISITCTGTEVNELLPLSFTAKSSCRFAALVRIVVGRDLMPQNIGVKVRCQPPTEE